MGKLQSDPSLLSLSAFLVLVVEIKKKKCEIPNVCHDLQVTSSCSCERRGFLIAPCKTQKPFGKSERI